LRTHAASGGALEEVADPSGVATVTDTGFVGGTTVVVADPVALDPLWQLADAMINARPARHVATTPTLTVWPEMCAIG